MLLFSLSAKAPNCLDMLFRVGSNTFSCMFGQSQYFQFLTDVKYMLESYIAHLHHVVLTFVACVLSVPTRKGRLSLSRLLCQPTSL